MKVELSYSHFTYPNSTTCVQYKKIIYNHLLQSELYILVNYFIWCPPKSQKPKTKPIQSHVVERECTKSHSVVYGYLMGYALILKHNPC